MADELRVIVKTDADIVTARQEGRALASRLSFSSSDLTVIATAISEVARNIVEYADQGELVFRLIKSSMRSGICVEAHDRGPGIPDLALAMQDGYSTGNRLGLGLPGAKRLMDEFEIETRIGNDGDGTGGTDIVMKKWAR